MLIVEFGCYGDDDFFSAQSAPLEFNKNTSELIPKFLPGLVGDLPEPENLKEKYSDKNKEIINANKDGSS